MLAVVAFALLAPLAVFAADSSIDPKCWPQGQQAQCGKLQGYFDSADLGKGRSADCGQGWFQCFSGNKPIDIAIHIGEVGEVRNFGEYIRLIYAWLIPVGAILAVVVIMIGGVIWLTSGGADRLSTAKQWIGNAIVGLLLLVFSYVILNTINPDLVRLSLPRTQILRPVVVGAQFCTNLGADVEVRRDSPEGSRVPSDQYACETEFYPVGTTTRTCQGSVCPAQKVCVTTDGSNFSCVEGSFAGTITTDGEAYVDNDVELLGVCADGRTWTVLETDARDVTPDHRKQQFVFPKVDSAQQLGGVPCSGVDAFSTDAQRRAAIRGLALKIEVDDAGADEWFAVERSSCSGTAQPIAVDGKDNPNKLDWTRVGTDKLFTLDQFYQMLSGSPPPCSLQLTKSVFDR